MDILDHLDRFWNDRSYVAVSPAFPERLHLAWRVFNGEPVGIYRSIAAPVYVSDLGVRRSNDPSIFYAEHCKIFGMQRLGFEGSELAISQYYDDPGVARLIDAFILFFGDYDFVHDVIISHFEELVSAGNYALNVYAATVLAAVGDRRCLELFDRAVHNADTSSNMYSAQHRAAAFDIKRLGRADLAKERLLAASRFLDDSNEARLNKALLLNLEALAIAKSDIDGAYKMLRDASDLIRQVLESLEIGVDNNHRGMQSRAVRYQSQIAINIAQLSLSIGNEYKALKILQKNLINVDSVAPDYRSEAAAELAYVEYLCGLYRESISHCQDALIEFSRIGAIQSIRTTRELMCAAYSRAGDSDAAQKTASICDTDSLGLILPSSVVHDLNGC